MTRTVENLIARGTRVRHEEHGEGVILYVVHDCTRGPYAASVLFRADVHLPLVPLRELREVPWTIETSKVPHEDPGFQKAMSRRGFSAEDAPFELRRECVHLPIVVASRLAMREIRLLPTFEPDMDERSFDTFARAAMSG